MRTMLSRFLVIGLVVLAFAPAYAQVETEIATERAQLQSDRQAIVAANLPLTEEQAKAFWPLYREYRGEIQKLGDQLVDLIKGYATNYGAVSDEQAATMLDEMLTLQKNQLKVKSGWVSKFGKVLPPKTVARFYQIENKLDAIMLYEAAAVIPLVENDTK